MNKFQKIYDENKHLDMMFDGLYNSHDEDIHRKNKLELLVELGELANETKCFKYWSNKPSDQEEIIEEFADCLIMVLSFFNYLNIDLEEEMPQDNNLDLIDEFIYLFNKSANLKENFNKDNLKDIYVNLLHLGYLLKLTDDQIINGVMKKIDKNYGRFSSGF